MVELFIAPEKWFTISYDSDICRQNLGIEVLEKQLGIWAASRGRVEGGRLEGGGVGMGVL